ncbi:hypothetical protein BDZ91DRAFT_670320, partial [Kalaharituber pfeilii]
KLPGMLLRSRPRWPSPRLAQKHQIELSSQGSAHKKWNQLSPVQKISRTPLMGGNQLVIAAGVVLTGRAATFFYAEVLASDSNTNWFNRVVERIFLNNPQCLQLLGAKRSIKAYGEPTNSRWVGNRSVV